MADSLTDISVAASPSDLPKLSYSFARENGIFARLDEGQPVIVRRQNCRLNALLEARRIIDCPARIDTVTGAQFEALIAQGYATGDLTETAETALEGPEDLTTLAGNLPRSADLLGRDDDAPVIRLINGILQEAIKTRASDIHIEPFERRLAVRFRIDGALRDMLDLSARLSSVLVSRVKVMAQLDIAKKRVPQDGRFSLNLGNRAVDVRVSTLPSQYGERVVMRILEKTSALLNMGDLGIDPALLEELQAALVKPNGIILVTGPTGSGKTTTLYAAVTGLNTGAANIMTVEDPVEYALDGIGQTQVNNQVGMSFAAGLRAILRQDPDVVMVGEIRDPETAEVAVQAALTGHLVLSTVHTNSSVAAIARLRDMGIEPFLLASTVTAILAQRLVRRLCDTCKTPYEPSARELSDLGLTDQDMKRQDMPKSGGAQFYKPVGCASCAHIGYMGRLGLYELVTMDDHLRGMVHDGAREIDMSAYAFKSKPTLLQSGSAHVLSGKTSVEEVLRVCRANTNSAEPG